ncbi:hypothetical protein PCANC_02571 [Puccinia coronata f. sp. avenae]|uniref:Meiotic sister chromatid recombination protein 1 n=1 Tax=Puccinia coronata f. sp. avenae TaxID=200324 RepID=A0A2N5VYM5_9BASI|nr:hypothetical protein PCANC_02571 [Puccinia coronata f. sp. avenae]
MFISQTGMIELITSRCFIQLGAIVTSSFNSDLQVWSRTSTSSKLAVPFLAIAIPVQRPPSIFASSCRLANSFHLHHPSHHLSTSFPKKATAFLRFYKETNNNSFLQTKSSTLPRLKSSSDLALKMLPLLGALVIMLLLAPRPAVALFDKKPSYNDWSDSKVEQWLTDHKIPNPGNLDSQALRELIQKKYDSAYDNWSDADLQAYVKKYSLPLSADKPREGIIDTIRQSYHGVVDAWSDSDLKSWMSDHGYPSPPSSTRQQLVDIVKANYQDSSQYLSSSAGSAQQVLQDTASSVFSLWTDSQLRDFLLEHGVVSPNSKREELVRAAKRYLNAGAQSASKLASSATGAAADAGSAAKNAAADAGAAAYDKASQAGHAVGSKAYEAGASVGEAASDAGSSAYDRAAHAGQAAGSAIYRTGSSAADATYEKVSQAGQSAGSAVYNTGSAATEAVKDSPGVVYDYLSAKFDDAKDYVYSSWSDNELRDYLIQKGAIKSGTHFSRNDLLQAIKDTYNDAAQNVYESWSDNRIRNWLADHGVVSNKASTREELVNLISQYYYGAKDTTYETWNSNELRSWLEKKGIIKPGTQKKKEDYLSLVADNYYSVRDKAFNNWNESSLRAWLESHGLSKTPGQAREDLLKVVQQNFYGDSDKIWDSWSNAEIKTYLLKNKLAEKSDVQNLRRDSLEKILNEKYYTIKENILGGWSESQMRQWLIENGFLKSDYQAKKDEILDLFSQKYSDAASKSSEYVSWSDNRVRGWLRTHGVEVPMSTAREELLQLMHEHYTESKGKMRNILSTVTSAFSSSEQALEDTIKRLKEAVGAGSIKQDAASYKDAVYENAAKAADRTKREL